VQLAYLYLVRKRSSSSVLLGFTVALMTWLKTMLYFMIEANCGFSNTWHNGAFDFWVLFVVTNGMWIVMPFAIVLTLGRTLLTKVNGQ
jgi:uroporphyrin-III C-methyltransferase